MQSALSQALYDRDRLTAFVLSNPSLEAVHRRFPFKITDHLASLVIRPYDPLWRQFIPDAREIEDDDGLEDPLGEEALSPIPGLVHRYPDRVLLLTTSRCAAFCRFCTRKRLWKAHFTIDDAFIREAVRYIRRREAVHDVILSGGDPLLLDEDTLARLLSELRSIGHLAVIRLGTRLPISDPKAVTTAKLRLLSHFPPLYVNLHINHPREISPPTLSVIEQMASAGIHLGSQTVLLRGINDDAETLRNLFLTLLRHRVRPYYLLQMDVVKGTAHFRTPIVTGLSVMDRLRHRLSGLAIPHFVVDLPGGGGKVELLPSPVIAIEEQAISFKNRLGGVSRYPLAPGEEELLRPLLSPGVPGLS